MSPTSRDAAPGQLIRGIGLWQATALNMIDMIGVGPFITIPLIIAAMRGPQAMLGWVLGALLVACDGLVWAELGATFPEAGGPVRYLREMCGPRFGNCCRSVHLAAHVQRAALDCLRLHRLRAIRGLPVAWLARRVGNQAWLFRSR